MKGTRELLLACLALAGATTLAVTPGCGDSGNQTSGCPADEVLIDGECVATSEACGDGTELDDGQCVSRITCGPGTESVDGECVPETPGIESCGEGTTRQGSMCIPEETVTCGPGTTLLDDACVLAEQGIECGPGTVLSLGECIPEEVLECGPGTVRLGDDCVSIVGCEDGTSLVDGGCVPDVVCGPGTIAGDGGCTPIDLTCGPGTFIQGDQCVDTLVPTETALDFDFSIADKGSSEIVYFLDDDGASVHRYDFQTQDFLSPFATPLADATALAVTPSGDAVYVGSAGGRIDRLEADDGSASFLVAAAAGVSWLHVLEDYLYVVDSSGSGDTHSTYDRLTGMLAFSDDTRYPTQGSAYAPTLQRIFTFRDGYSPNDVYYETFDTSTGALGLETESPYHGDYLLGHPMRVSPDESLVFVASGVAFDTTDLTYAEAIGFSYVDLLFHDGSLYLLRPSGDDSLVTVLNDGYDILRSFEVVGLPLRLFLHGDDLAVFTRSSGNIAVWHEAL